jgi:hypothetical protein
VFLSLVAKLTVFFPGEEQLHIMNAASPASGRKTRLFVHICRNFDKDAPLQPTLDFNYQVFAEDIAIVSDNSLSTYRSNLRLKLTFLPTGVPSLRERHCKSA